MSEIFTDITSRQVEQEKSFIGCAVVSPEYVRKECGWLDPGIFADEQLGKVWAGILDGGEPLTVAARYDMGSEIFGYMNRTPNFNTAGQFANAIAEANFFRQAFVGASDIVKAISRGDRGEIEAIVDAIKNTDDGQVKLDDNPIDAAENLISRLEDGNMSLKFGIDSLDWATGGPEIGTATLFAARTSMGKSALAIDVAEHMALEQGKRVGFFALEMSAEQFMARRNCHLVNNMDGFPASWQDVRSGNITPEAAEQLKGYIRGYAKKIFGKLDIITKTSTTSVDVIRIQSKAKYDAIFVDHLGLLKDTPRKGERWDQLLGRIAINMHELAKNTKAVVIVIHQLNREVGARAGNEPTLTDLRDSGKIEENFDNVFLLHRESYWDPSKEKEIDPMKVIIAKYRDGARFSTCYVGFDLRAQKFTALYESDLDQYADEEMEKARQAELPEAEDVPF